MDWFERLTGFRETDYASTQARLEVADGRLRSKVNGAAYGVGRLELVSLGELRARVNCDAVAGRLSVEVVRGDVRRLHQDRSCSGALFQVASQFNLLEMVSERVTPDDGVTRYASDPTQGPACAIAAGAATIYRNYFAPVGAQVGQTREAQLDGLHDLGAALARQIGVSPSDLWRMQNGYALCTAEGLRAIAGHLRTLSPEALEALGGMLRIGLHWDVEATEAPPGAQYVTQAFCSALPVAYTTVARHLWEKFATLVLEAAYEATLWAAAENAARGVSNKVLLTRLGGGAFGNDDRWIDAAMMKALRKFSGAELKVQLVSYGPPTPGLLRIADVFGEGATAG